MEHTSPRRGGDDVEVAESISSPSPKIWCLQPTVPLPRYAGKRQKEERDDAPVQPDIADWTYWALRYASITQFDTIVAKIEKAGDVDEHDVQNFTELGTAFKSETHDALGGLRTAEGSVVSVPYDRLLQVNRGKNW